MRQIVLGTSNPAKKESLQAALVMINVKVIASYEIGHSIEVSEDGNTIIDNARRKALAYAEILQRRVLSTDCALYLSGLKNAEQLGMFIRRGIRSQERASDEDLLAYVAKKIEPLGGIAEGHYETALCLALPDEGLIETIIKEPVNFVSIPSPTVLSGAPLASIRVDPSSGKYLSEMTLEERVSFWQAAFGLEVCEFIRDALGRANGLLD
ncbi:MAG: non-canonical purine NTP pyrophosphatase [Candidatus Thorarchaeota archaeon]|jgi:inosine/xanthosine triphosphate pyrophosphatase family protein